MKRYEVRMNGEKYWSLTANYDCAQEAVKSYAREYDRLNGNENVPHVVEARENGSTESREYFVRGVPELNYYVHDLGDSEAIAGKVALALGRCVGGTCEKEGQERRS